MAKAFTKPSKKKDNGPYISSCGSHGHMVVTRMTENLSDAFLLVCKDEKGHYLTNHRNVDSGLMDPCRMKCKRVRDEELAAEGIVIGVTHNDD